MAMMIKESCCWFTNGYCKADHCSECEKWYDYYRKQKGCSPT